MHRPKVGEAGGPFVGVPQQAHQATKSKVITLMVVDFMVRCKMEFSCKERLLIDAFWTILTERMRIESRSDQESQCAYITALISCHR